jgi:hypothetical protein
MGLTKGFIVQPHSYLFILPVPALLPALLMIVFAFKVRKRI